MIVQVRYLTCATCAVVAVYHLHRDGTAPLDSFQARLYSLDESLERAKTKYKEGSKHAAQGKWKGRTTSIQRCDSLRAGTSITI